MLDREPRQGTKMAQALPYLRQGLPVHQVARLLDIEVEVASNTRANLVGFGLIDHLDQEGLLATKSLAQGGIWFYSEPFLRLQMTNLETSEAIRQVVGIHIEPKNIASASRYAARKGRFKREWQNNPVLAHRVETKSKTTPELLVERIKNWIEADKILTETGIDKSPYSRKDWLLLARYTQICREIGEGNQEAVVHEATFLAGLDPETEKRLTPSLDLINTNLTSFSNEELISLFEEKRGLIFNIIKRRVGNYETAEDLVSETFYKALSRRSKYRHIKGIPLLAWVTTIAKNTVVDYLRKQKSRTYSPIDEQTQTDYEDFTLDIEANTTLKELLENLSDEEKSMLLMKYSAQLSDTRIGELLGKERREIKNLYTRILRKLRRIASGT